MSNEQLERAMLISPYLAAGCEVWGEEAQQSFCPEWWMLNKKGQLLAYKRTNLQSNNENCKPILRGVEDMTEEEMRKTCQLEFGVENTYTNFNFTGVLEPFTGFYFNKRDLDSWYNPVSYCRIADVRVSTANYLRSILIDIDGLIKKGWAVDKKTIEKEAIK